MGVMQWWWKVLESPAKPFRVTNLQSIQTDVLGDYGVRS